VTDCGEFDALLVTTKVAVSATADVGVKVNWIVQLPPAARLAGQLFVPRTKSLALVPVIAIPLIVTATADGLVAVTVRTALVVFTCWLPNGTLAGESEIVPDTGTPVPVNATVSGDDALLFVMVSTPVRVPETVGVNVTATGQVLVGARVVPQVPVCATTWKSPVAEIELKVRAEAVSVFLTVTVCAALADPNA
jgi:hypothetical protein